MKTSSLEYITDYGAVSTTELFADLADSDILVRERACHELVARGDEVVPDLIAALHSAIGNVRREAVAALREIGNPEAAPALVQVLSDERLDVRWIAAEALLDLGQAGLPPLLQALTTAPWDALRLRESAHHILRIMGAQRNLHPILAPVVSALEGLEPGLTVPLTAHHALEMLSFKSAQHAR